MYGRGFQIARRKSLLYRRKVSEHARYCREDIADLAGLYLSVKVPVYARLHDVDVC